MRQLPLLHFIITRQRDNCNECDTGKCRTLFCSLNVHRFFFFCNTLLFKLCYTNFVASICTGREGGKA